jgi:hypothetical protein
MSDQITIALINSIPAWLTALGTLVTIILGFRNHSKIANLEINVNGRLSELVKASKDSGRVAEAEDQHARDAAKDAEKG